jgi:hypothetical protein
VCADKGSGAASVVLRADVACEVISVDGAVFVVWGEPTKQDLDEVVKRVEYAAAEAGRPVVYITRVPEHAPAPEGEVRAHMNALMPRFIKVCSSYHAVLEGRGFVSAVKRMVLASIFQFGFRSGTFFVHDSERSILDKVEPGGRRAVEAILAQAAAKGLLLPASKVL